MRTLREAWHSNRALTTAFVIVCLISLLLGVRLVGSYIYWTNHANEPLQNWMRLGYISKSHNVDVESLRQSIGLPPDQRERRPLEEIAAERGVDPSELKALLEAEIARIKANGKSR